MAGSVTTARSPSPTPPAALPSELVLEPLVELAAFLGFAGVVGLLAGVVAVTTSAATASGGHRVLLALVAARLSGTGSPSRRLVLGLEAASYAALGVTAVTVLVGARDLGFSIRHGPYGGPVWVGLYIAGFLAVVWLAAVAATGSHDREGPDQSMGAELAVALVGFGVGFWTLLVSDVLGSGIGFGVEPALGFTWAFVVSSAALAVVGAVARRWPPAPAPDEPRFAGAVFAVGTMSASLAWVAGSLLDTGAVVVLPPIGEGVTVSTLLSVTWTYGVALVALALLAVGGVHE